MRYAFAKDGTRVIDARTFDKEVGYGDLKRGQYDKFPVGLCMHCKQPVMIRAGGIVARHFYHQQNDSSVFCPMRESGAADAILHMEKQEKPSEELLSAMKAHWQAIFIEIQRNIEGFSLAEYWALLETASHAKLFHRKTIRKWMLPYVMMGLRDFPTETSYKKQRKHRLRFYFVSRYNATTSKRAIWVEKDDLPRQFCCKPDVMDEKPREVTIGAYWITDNLKVRWLTQPQIEYTESLISSIT